MEAIPVALVGGLIGIGLGVVSSYAIGSLAQWQIRIQPTAIGMAFVSAAAVGVFFGLYPARKAAHLDPIEVMRYE